MDDRHDERAPAGLRRVPRPAPKLARPDEAERIHALLWACRDEIPLEPSFWDDVTRSWLEDFCRRRLILVVRDADNIAGAALLHHAAGARARAGDWAELKYLVVAPAHRRRGVGRALLRHIKARWAALRVFANVSNAPIRQLLAEEGFQQHGAVKFGGWMMFWWPRPFEGLPPAPAGLARARGGHRQPGRGGRA